MSPEPWHCLAPAAVAIAGLLLFGSGLFLGAIFGAWWERLNPIRDIDFLEGKHFPPGNVPPRRSPAPPPGKGTP